MPKRKTKRGKTRYTFDFPKGKSFKTSATIYVPDTKKGNKKIKPSTFKKRINETQKFLTKKFGGSTRVKGYGTYKGKRKVTGEKVALVQAYTTPKKYRKHDQSIKKHLTIKKKQWGQESIGYEYNNKLYRV